MTLERLIKKTDSIGAFVTGAAFVVAALLVIPAAYYHFARLPLPQYLTDIGLVMVLIVIPFVVLTLILRFIKAWQEWRQKTATGAKNKETA